MASKPSPSAASDGLSALEERARDLRALNALRTELRDAVGEQRDGMQQAAAAAVGGALQAGSSPAEQQISAMCMGLCSAFESSMQPLLGALDKIEGRLTALEEGLPSTATRVRAARAGKGGGESAAPASPEARPDASGSDGTPGGVSEEEL